MNNKTKTILCASLIVAMATSLYTMDFAEAKQSKEDKHDVEIRNLFTEIDQDIKEYVKTDMTDPVTKKDELKTIHSDKLNVIASKIAQKINYPYSDDDLDGLIDLMIREHISEMHRQQRASEIPEDAITVIIDVNAMSTLGYFELPTAFAATHDIPYPISVWKQVKVDLTGGSGTDLSGDDYDIDGGNYFSMLKIDYTSTSVEYTLTFDGEDHPDPWWDEYYDSYRESMYERTTDIESFTIDEDGLEFSNIWSDEETFANFLGVHNDTVLPYTDGMDIFISNTWNHAMGTTNTNTDMEITDWTVNP